MKKVRLFASVLVTTVMIAVGVAAAAPAQASVPFPECRYMTASTTASDGVPGPLFYKHMQCFARYGGVGGAYAYTGALDGVAGVNTWKGVQARLALFGMYSGAIDGIPGTGTYSGLQKYAAAYGMPRYTGPIDGVPGPNTYRSLAGTWNYDFSGA